jgi:hypothetical protein
MASSVRHLVEAGRRLAEKRDSLDYGEWLPWLEANADALGFGERTARRLMGAARNRTPASDLDEEAAIQLSRLIWGHVGDSLRPPGPRERALLNSGPFSESLIKKAYKAISAVPGPFFMNIGVPHCSDDERAQMGDVAQEAAVGWAAVAANLGGKNSAAPSTLDPTAWLRASAQERTAFVAAVGLEEFWIAAAPDLRRAWIAKRWKRGV